MDEFGELKHTFAGKHHAAVPSDILEEFWKVSLCGVPSFGAIAWSGYRLYH